MVSFQCESCGDVFTKKKLDPHRGQCRGASFTCLDCMVHFQGTDYKSHTSCVSEAQKYHGALYREKPSKLPKKAVQTSDSTSQVPRKAYVEDAPENESRTALAVVDAPPEAPSPPPAVPAQTVQPVNVFDFLVTEDTPNASKISLGGTKEQMQMVDHAPSVFEPAIGELDTDGNLHEYDPAYEEHGYSYGTTPIPATHSQNSSYLTPAAKHFANGSQTSVYELESTSSLHRSTDKKRKRQQIEDLDLTAARRLSQEPDSIMADAPPAILHSGLTGGLNRLLSKSKFPPSPDDSSNSQTQDRSPPSPADRPQKLRVKDGSLKESSGRGRKVYSSALVKIRKPSSSRRTSDEQSRPRKHRRSHHEDSSHHAHHHASTTSHDRPRRKLKAIEPAPATTTAGKDSQQQLILYRTRAELFLSFVNKGPDSEKGMSVNKVLKRYHRERGEKGMGLGKGEEEKELWRCLRMRRNERGEVVVVF